MIGLVVTLRVKEGQEAAFETAMKTLIPQVRANEPGCTLYSMTKKPGEAGVYVMMEQYVDKAALDHHGKTPYFQAALPALGAALAGPPETLTLDVLV